MGSQFLLWLQAARATSQSGIFLLWQTLMWQKIAFFKSKNVFSIGYVKKLPICMHPSNACLLSLTKTKRKILLHRGIAWVTLFIVLLLDLMIQRRWKKTSLDQAQAQQKGSLLILMFFVLFFHVVCKISNFNMWTAKHLAKVLVLSLLYLICQQYADFPF